MSSVSCVFQAFRISDGYSENLDAEETDAVTSCELTIYEFADVLSMKPNSVFIKNMFDLIDKDRNGLVSFREFLDVIVIFAKGIVVLLLMRRIDSLNCF